MNKTYLNHTFFFDFFISKVNAMVLMSLKCIVYADYQNKMFSLFDIWLYTFDYLINLIIHYTLLINWTSALYSHYYRFWINKGYLDNFFCRFLVGRMHEFEIPWLLNPVAIAFVQKNLQKLIQCLKIYFSTTCHSAGKCEIYSPRIMVLISQYIELLYMEKKL